MYILFIFFCLEMFTLLLKRMGVAQKLNVTLALRLKYCVQRRRNLSPSSIGIVYVHLFDEN